MRINMADCLITLGTMIHSLEVNSHVLHHALLYLVLVVTEPT